MKSTACLALFLFALASSISAQLISPVPVVETEVRDNSSIKMRSIELDRVKREARKTTTEKLGPAAVNNFLEIKDDFEKIQKLEGDIVSVYMTGKQIQYAKIASFSAEINTSAARLSANLFSLPANDRKADALGAKENLIPLSSEVKTLIVELDNAIAAFVNNPIFQNSKKARLKEREQAEENLQQVIRLSEALKSAAEQQTQAKK